MVFEDLKKALFGAIMDLTPTPIPDEVIEFEEVTLDRSEADNSKWLSYITAALKNAYLFEIAEKNTKFVGWKQKLTDEKREKLNFLYTNN